MLIQKVKKDSYVLLALLSQFSQLYGARGYS